MSSVDPVSMSRLTESLTAPWETRDLVSVQDSVLRFLRLEGTMEWHHHEEDQLFICWEGSFSVEFEKAPAVPLNRGDVFVIPRGVNHRTSAGGVAYALMSIGTHTLARP